MDFGWMEYLRSKRQQNPKLILLFLSLWLTSAVISNCTYQFTMIADPDGGDDSSFYTETESNTDTGADTDDTEQDSETEAVIDTTPLPPCPTGIEFNSDPLFTQMASVKDTTSGTVYPDSCGPLGVVMGYQGKLFETTDLTAHGQIQAICGVPSVIEEDGGCVVKIATGETLPMRGNNGKVEWQRLCPADQIIVGYYAKTGSNIDSLRFTCAPLVISEDATGHKITRGNPSQLMPAGGIGGPTVYEDYCVNDQIAVISSFRSDNVLLGFGLGCQAPSPIY